MTKVWITGALAALALAGCQQKEAGSEEQASGTVPATAAPVAAATADPAAARPLSSFAGMDVDNDGKVTSAEHARATQTMYRMMDADLDGTVTAAEMDAARAAIGGNAALSAMSSERKIALIDGDNDGTLTLAEHVAGANAMFARMDANRDDALDQPEWDELHNLFKPTSATTPTAN